MVVRETYEKMPKSVKFVLDDLKKSYKAFPERRDETRARAAGYVMGLRDAGLITERERQILFIHTVA